MQLDLVQAAHASKRAAPNAAVRETSQRQPPEARRDRAPSRGGAKQDAKRHACRRGHRKPPRHMLLLFETAAGHALYELKHEEKLKKLDADKLASKLSPRARERPSPSKPSRRFETRPRPWPRRPTSWSPSSINS